jgi:hypothetical protein
MSQQETQDGLLLPGLDGTNPLGFLAAMGVLRVLSLQKHGVKLSWQLSGGTWRAKLFGVRVPLPDLGAELHAAIRKLDQSAWSIDKKLPFEANKFRRVIAESIEATHSKQRFKVDLLAAFGVECVRDKKGNFEETKLRLVRTADNKKDKEKKEGLLGFAATTIETTSVAQIQEALSSNWLYKDKQLTFRWDPAEDRGYALQWDDPGPIGAMTQRGANCLALFGMTCFPVIPVKGQAKTTGFELQKSDQTAFTWPIWKHPINLGVIRSLLTSSELQPEQPDRFELASLGIAAAYRCNRVMTSTYYANFTPSQRVA